MVSKQTLINHLPAFRNDVKLIKQKQGTDDIINEVLLKHVECESDYDLIFKFFDNSSIYNVCKNIWEFLKYNLIYNAEKGKDQSVKSPAAILSENKNIDCKHYSLFAGGILDAIKRAYYQGGNNFDWCYRFASETDINYPTHVFVVVFDRNKEYWIDACLTNFNQRKKYVLEIDENPMALYSISGVNDPKTQIVDVDKILAWQSFLTIINENFLSLKDLLIEYPETTKNALKNYCLSMGFDYNQLCNYLNS